jgi:hypothetical protein
VERRRLVGLLLLAALSGAVGGPLLKDALGTPHALKLAGYGILTFTAAAITAAALLDRAARVLERVRDELRAAAEA